MFSVPQMADQSHPVLNSALPQRKHLRGDVIDISSSPQEHSRFVKHRRRDKPTIRTPHVPSSEVIEISSDDEEASTQQSTITGLQRQLKKIREENSSYRRNVERMRREITVLREENRCLKIASQNPAAGKVLIDESQFDDYLSCEICANKMWSPYILPGCGHSFCQACLQDWFTTTLAQYMNNHPEYDPIVNANRMVAILADPHILHHPQLGRYLAHRVPPEPSYTCPTCRVPVKSKPIEDFALKSLIRMIATASGEACPPDAANPSPWDGFFPNLL